MKRKHKKYSKPKRPFDKARIDEEAVIKKEYGLKNKREIWKADAKVRLMRQKAKRLIKASKEEQQALFDRLQKRGFKVVPENICMGLANIFSSKTNNSNTGKSVLGPGKSFLRD